MDVIKKQVRLNPLEYYSKHLELINVLLPQKMVPKEVEVLANFMALEDAVVEDDRFNTLARKRVRASIGISYAGLSNNLSSLIEKGYLVKSPVTGRITISPLVVPEDFSQTYLFKFIKLDGPQG